MSQAPALDACLADAFERLAGAVADRHAALHTPTLVTLSVDGAPEARTMVLRHFDAAGRTLRLHTDARSGKIAGIARDPRCQLHGYDPAAKVQLRLTGVVAVHDFDGIADAAWAGSRATSRLCYAAAEGPGAPVPEPPPAPRDPSGGRANFRALVIRFHQLECLQLAAAGHRRARFVWCDGDTPAATWLAP